MPELFHLHPMAVHFPIVLLALGLSLALWDLRGSGSAWRAEAVSWLLWLGAASAWVALGLGLLAERTAPHVPLAWEAQADHELLAWWTCGVFTALSVLRAAQLRLAWRGRAFAWLLAAAWLAGFGLLAAAAKKGGELVYAHGVGVAGAP